MALNKLGAFEGWFKVSTWMSTGKLVEDIYKEHFFNLLVGIPECASLPLPSTGQREGVAFTEPFEQIEKTLFSFQLFLASAKKARGLHKYK